MIVITQRSVRSRSNLASNRKFLEMLPVIRRQAYHAFRGLNPELREELVSEVIANAYVAFVRLVQRDKADLAYATPLAQFGIKQVRAGRRVGTRLNVRDVTSFLTQQRRGFRLGRLGRYDAEECQWLEIVVEDRHCGPDHVAMVRLDFASWLRSLSRRKHKIATTLAIGESTGKVARKFHLSPGRVSQLRRELHDAWVAFTAERSAADVPA